MSQSSDGVDNRFTGENSGTVFQVGRVDNLHLVGQPGDTSGPDEEFAARYRDFIVGSLDRFEFFGVDPRGIPRRHHFDAGYVPLTLNPRDLGEDATVSAGARADDALRGHRKALIRGVAGSGKSTLQRWLAVDAARDTDSLPSTVPFLLELGRFADGHPPELGELVSDALRPAMPAGWVHRMLRQGRVVLLLDGLDEVNPRERGNLEQWVEEHLVAFPETRCVVTTRPSIVAEKWWTDLGFHRFDLLPMSRHSIERYLRGWHDAARADQPDTVAGEEVRAELTRCERQLSVTLSNRPALRGMGANPLLCGLLCALHLERGEHLPESRKQVYDAALDLLLVRWRHLRRRHRARESGGADTETDPPLRDDELQKLLQRLAFWLVANRLLVVSSAVAERRVAAFMFGLRNSDEQPKLVWQYLANHSGLLRELPDGSLEFVHRTFRDHLAAKEVVEEENLPMLLDNADKPHWHDVVVMAGAHARPGERNWILLSLLDRGRSDAEQRDALYLLAAAILEQTSVLPPDSSSPNVRERVTAAMAQLIPPRTAAAADQLAATGPFVLDLMPGPDGLADEQAELVVRAAARIAAQWNPPGAIEKILQFTARPTKGMFSQLLEPWGRLGDYEAYAREVLSEFDFGRFTVDLQNGRRIEHLGFLRTIRNLLLRNDLSDLQPLAALPALHRLTLRDNTRVKLAKLAGVQTLRVVVLDRCSTMADTRPVDLSLLAVLPLRRLVVSGLTTKVDLAGLAEFRLDSLRIAVPLRGEPALPAGLHVRHLTLVGGGRRIGLAGVLGVRSIIVDWVPDQEDLAGLTELRRLVLVRVPAGTPTPELPGVAVTVLTRP